MIFHIIIPNNKNIHLIKNMLQVEFCKLIQKNYGFQVPDNLENSLVVLYEITLETNYA